MGPIHIGWATRDITPDGTVRVIGQFHVRVSTGVESPLSCTALALESGGTQAVLVSVDGPYVIDEIMQECKRRLAKEALGLDPDYICLSTTHTHTAACQASFWYPPELPEGVAPDQQYADLLTDALVEVVKDAWNTRGPAQVSWGWGEAVVGRNRRVHYEDGTGQLYGPTATPAFRNMEGSADPSVNLLFTYDDHGELTGIVVNVPCPAQTQESEAFLSADFWHPVREEIRRRYGDGIFVLPQCAFAGDQSPHPLVHTRELSHMLHLKGMMPSKTEDTFDTDLTRAQCGLIAGRIAAAIDETAGACEKAGTADLTFSHTRRILDLPRRVVTTEEARLYGEEATREREKLATLTPDPADPVYTSCYSRIIYNEEVVKRYEDQLDNPSYPAQVHVLRIGDMAMVFASFEAYLDYGLRVQERSPAVQTFTVQLLSQDSGNPGYYLPTERAVKAGDCGGNIRDSLVGPEGGQLLVDSIVEMLNEMWKED